MQSERASEEILGDIRAALAEIRRADRYAPILSFTAEEIGYRADALDSPRGSSRLNKKYADARR